MTDEPDHGIADQAIDEAGSSPVSSDSLKTTKEPPRSFLSRARRDLNEDELSSAAARRFLIAEIERLDSENGELQDFRERYYASYTDLSVLREIVRKDQANEILSFTCLSVGAAGLGAAPSYFSNLVGGIILLGLSIVLIGAGIITRIRR